MKLQFSKKNAHWLKETICNVIDFTHFIIRLQSNETRLQSNEKRLQKNVIYISWNVHVLLYYFRHFFGLSLTILMHSKLIKDET